MELWMLLSCFDDQCVAAVVVVVAVDAVVMVVVVDFADVVVIVVVFDERCPVSMGQDQRWMTTTVATVVDDFEAIASCHCRWIFGVWRNDPVSDSFLFVRICCCSAVVVSAAAADVVLVGDSVEVTFGDVAGAPVVAVVGLVVVESVWLR